MDKPARQPILRLDLLMQREYAEEILRGEKKIEFRDATRYYFDKLVDRSIMEYNRKENASENPVRSVYSIHFHNYNNTWYLDVEVRRNDFVKVTKDDVKALQEHYGCHDLDEELEDYEKRRISEKNRPHYYFFVLGSIIKTNLMVNKKQL